MLTPDQFPRFYRYTDGAGVLQLDIYYGWKETPKGFWITNYRKYPEGDAMRKWVSTKSVRSFAYMSQTEAWGSYKARKRSQMLHVIAELSRVAALWNFVLAQDKPPLDPDYTEAQVSSFTFDVPYPMIFINESDELSREMRKRFKVPVRAIHYY